jgi:site-specific DNA-methyltransferase (adenine-specific)
MNAYEMILMLRKGKAKNINIMGSKNIIRVPNITRIKQHPTEKPVDLMRLLIENSSQKGEIVLDPFMGVGGVGLACKRTNRGFIGVEIDEKYFNIAKQRIDNDLDYVPEKGPEQMNIFDFI